MSDILNHYYCAKEVSNLLLNEKDISNIIKNNFDAYRLGSQGPDFFYYNVFNNHKLLSYKFGRLIHTKKINEFFYYGLKFAQNHPEYRNITLAYLMGFLTHHSLDSKTHPFIYYRTGTGSNDSKEKSRSSRLHKLYEVLLDTAMTQYEYSRQAVYENPEKVFMVSSFTLKFLDSFYTYILKKLYDLELPKNMVRDSLRTGVFFVNLFKDGSGFKKKLVSKIEKYLDENKLVTRYFYPMYTNEYEILNINEKSWKHPVTGEVFSTTYPQLFHDSVEKSVDKIKNLYNLFDKNTYSLEDIDNFINNESYFTGLPVDKAQNFQYIDEDFKNNLENNY